MRRRERIDIFTSWVNRFTRNKKNAGYALLISASLAIILANSSLSEFYFHFWETSIGFKIGNYQFERSLHFWINEGLMTLFFFFVGLELKREFRIGVLSKWNSAILPFSAAAGGMLFPALIFLLINYSNGDSVQGWAIPTATDIAFILGLTALAGDRIPVSFKALLTAIAVADDLGAVLVIAFFFTDQIQISPLLFALIFFLILLLANRLGIRSTLFYGIIGIGGLWISMLLGGVHTTIAGVVVAFAIPARTKVDTSSFIRLNTMAIRGLSKENEESYPLAPKMNIKVLEQVKHLTRHAQSPLQRLEYTMKPFVNFIILPLFAMANAGVILPSLNEAFGSITIGVTLGMVLGKFIGIGLTVWLLVRMGLATLPPSVKPQMMPALSMLAGVGFTMSLFITELAYTNSHSFIEQAKAGVIVGSLLAGVIGMFLIRRFPKKSEE